jgi:hypothetical protein
MGWEDILNDWKKSIPTEERLNKVLNVVKNKFQKWDWMNGSHIKITDNRLLQYKRKIRPQDKNVAIDGSFQIPTIKGRKVLGQYIQRILDMIEIVELCDQYLRGH